MEGQPHEGSVAGVYEGPGCSVLHSSERPLYADITVMDQEDRMPIKLDCNAPSADHENVCAVENNPMVYDGQGWVCTGSRAAGPSVRSEGPCDEIHSVERASVRSEPLSGLSENRDLPTTCREGLLSEERGLPDLTHYHGTYQGTMVTRIKILYHMKRRG